MNQFDADVEVQRTGFIYAGLPGAGKTEVANTAVQLSGGTAIEGGKYIREVAEEDGLTDYTSHELGKWAAEARERFGNGFLSQRIIGMINRGEIDVPAYPIHYDSVRNLSGIREWREFFTTSFVVMVKAPFKLRLQRLRERGDEDESEFTEFDLLERDERELNKLGTSEIIKSDEVDIVLENTYEDIVPLRAEVQSMMNDYTQYRNNA